MHVCSKCKKESTEDHGLAFGGKRYWHTECHENSNAKTNQILVPASRLLASQYPEIYEKIDWGKAHAGVVSLKKWLAAGGMEAQYSAAKAQSGTAGEGRLAMSRWTEGGVSYKAKQRGNKLQFVMHKISLDGRLVTRSNYDRNHIKELLTASGYSAINRAAKEIVDGLWVSGAVGVNTTGACPPPKPRGRRSERVWTDVFTPQTHGSGISKGKRTGKPRSNPDPVLYSGHVFTGYIETPSGNEVLAVVMKTGKSDHFEYERRQTARTFGLLMKTFEVIKVEKDKQAKAEVDKRNALRTEIRNQFKVFHFGENDAIEIQSKDEAASVIASYFQVAKEATTKVVA